MSATPGRRTQRAGSGAAPSVWLRPTTPGRADPVTTREQIVRAAVALLDEQGVARLTMRRLAGHLGIAATTLYLHVDGKDDVLDLALDAVFTETPLPQGPQHAWRDNITALITEWRATMLCHPWSVSVLDRPQLGPNILARTEYLHTALLTAGFTGPQLTAAACALANYVIGSAMTQASGNGADESQQRQAADQHLRQHRDQYPALAAHGAPIDNDWDAVFAQGLTYLLNGIEMR